MEAKYKDLQSLDQFIDEKIGKKVTTKRDEFETAYEAFKLGVLSQIVKIKRALKKQIP